MEQPIFENRTTLDEPALVEWQKAELRENYRPVYALCWAMLALCATCGFVAAYTAAVTGFIWGWALLGLFLALGAVLVWVTLTLPRRLVRMALRKGKGGALPLFSLAVGYPGALLVLDGDAEPGREEKNQAYMTAARGLQQRMQALMESARGIDASDEAALTGLRDELEDAKAQMYALNTLAPKAAVRQRLDTAQLTGYLRTGRLHGLYFGETAVLLDAGGFASPAQAAAFDGWLRQALEQAAGRAEGPAKKRLDKTLAAGRTPAAGQNAAGTEEEK